jgi:serine protease Do
LAVQFRSALVVVALLCCSLVRAQDGAAATSAEPVSPGIAAARQLGQAFAEVARKVTPAVVNISSTRVEGGRRIPMSPLFREFFGDDLVEPTREVQSLGSGVIVRPDGYIVTNCHVIQGAQEIKVKLSDEREFDARLVGQDPYTDLAVVRIDATGLPILPFGKSDELQVGEWVVAVGSPLGLSGTVTAGIVSAKGRKNVGILDDEDFIQTDAAINPGNSGGALVNLDGKLVGINTAIASEGGGYDGVCFATPSAVVWPVADALIRDGRIRRPWLGIIARDLDARLAQRLGCPDNSGALISNMVRNAPAHRGKLLPGDVVVMFGDSAVKSRADLQRLIRNTAVGTATTVTIYRQGEKQQVSITVGERPSSVETKGML